MERRIKQLDTRPFPLELVCKIYSSHAYEIEQKLHRELSSNRISGEWYDFFEFNEVTFKTMVQRIEETLN